LEIPQVLALAASNGLISSSTYDEAKYDGAIALGCVIRGETSHYDIVCGQANHWLNEVAITDALPLGNAILTVDNETQAIARAEGGRKGKGADAVRACLSVIQAGRAFQSAADGELDDEGSI
jgi:6,7-dimethyl-8-ribityllumazine synthase